MPDQDIASAARPPLAARGPRYTAARLLGAAAALTAALAACDVSGPAVNLAPACPYDDSSFNRDLGMQPQPDACTRP